MATTKFKGQPVKIIGEFIKVGTVAPDFELVKTDLSSFFSRCSRIILAISLAILSVGCDTIVSLGRHALAN